MRPAGSGFTLAEVVVATAVAAFLAAVSALSLSSAFRAFGAISARGPALSDAAARLDALETLRMDLSCALPPPATRFSGSDTGFSCSRLVSPARANDGFLLAGVSWGHGPGGAAERRVSTAISPDAPPRRYPESWGAPVFAWAMSVSNAAPAGSGGATGHVDWRDDWTGERPPSAARVRWLGREMVVSVMAGGSAETDGSGERLGRASP